TLLALALLVYVLFWEPFQANSRRLQRSVAELRADLAWMQQAARDIKRLDGAGEARPADDGRSLLTLVDQTARTAGLSDTLKRVAPQGTDQLSAQLDLVEFDRLIGWLGDLERNHSIGIVNLSVDRTSAAGRVNARVIVRSARS
ncbi:type II secretion system protein GspM, partial [Arthrospira platensis SPKY1]|nr:type II secretion system protein GspM [Arthrospira platensis SPKY1]